MMVDPWSSDRVQFSNIERFNITGSRTNDSIRTGNNADTINGAGGSDLIDAGGGADKIILADAIKQYYDDLNITTAGTSDYANILGFESQDVVQLAGSPSLYRLNVVGSNTELYLDKSSSEPDELIGIFQGVANLSLTSDNFIYIQPVNLSVSTTAGRESDRTIITLTATTPRPVSRDESVRLSMSGSASLADYILSGNVITIPKGSSKGSVSFTVVDDALIEPTETAIATLSDPSQGLALGTTIRRTVNIINDDFPFVNLSISRQVGTEAEATIITITATATSPVLSNQTVSLSVTGVGISTADYALSSNTITIPRGQISGTSTLTIIDDILVERTETAMVGISSVSSGLLLGSATVQSVNIADNDFPVITLGSAAASVGEDGTSNLLYTFTRSDDIASTLTVNYTVGGTAILGSDYTGIDAAGTTKSITFAAGAATAVVAVDPTADSDIEAAETVVLTLAPGSGYTIGTVTPVTGTIANDDFPSITLAVTPASVTEDGSSNLIHTFTRTGPTSSDLTVNYTVSGTATISTDYTGIDPAGSTKSITFAAGSATATLTIDPTADAEIESDETIELALVPGSGYTIGTTTPVTSTISNDDFPAITLAIAPVAVTEDGSSNLIYTFTRTGPTTTALTANYTLGGTARLVAAASDPADYIIVGSSSTATARTVTFAAGSATATVSVDPIADTTIEVNETVALTLAAGSGYTIGTATAVTGTITNDDPRITLAVAPASVTEDGANNLAFTFTRTGLTTNPLTVNYTVSGTATLGTDYTGIATTPATKTVTFAAGSATAVVTVDPTADTSIEPNETVGLRLASGSGYTIGTTATVNGTITNDDVTSATSFVLGSNQSSLGLTGSAPITGTGNILDNTIIGNAANNSIAGLGGKDILTGGGTTDRDVFVYTQLSDSLPLDPISGTGGYFDEITDFNSNDRITAPGSVATNRLTGSLGTADSIAPAAIAAVLTPSAFAPNAVVAFTASSHAGTFIAMNDGRAGFQSDTDSILLLRNYSISATNFVEFV
jgi:hypothetical protein